MTSYPHCSEKTAIENDSLKFKHENNPGERKSCRNYHQNKRTSKMRLLSTSVYRKCVQSNSKRNSTIYLQNKTLQVYHDSFNYNNWTKIQYKDQQSLLHITGAVYQLSCTVLAEIRTLAKLKEILNSVSTNTNHLIPVKVTSANIY